MFAGFGIAVIVALLVAMVTVTQYWRAPARAPLQYHPNAERELRDERLVSYAFGDKAQQPRVFEDIEKELRVRSEKTQTKRKEKTDPLKGFKDALKVLWANRPQKRASTKPEPKIEDILAAVVAETIAPNPTLAAPSPAPVPNARTLRAVPANGTPSAPPPPADITTEPPGPPRQRPGLGGLVARFGRAKSAEPTPPVELAPVAAVTEPPTPPSPAKASPMNFLSRLFGRSAAATASRRPAPADLTDEFGDAQPVGSDVGSTAEQDPTHAAAAAPATADAQVITPPVIEPGRANNNPFAKLLGKRTPAAPEPTRSSKDAAAGGAVGPIPLAPDAAAAHHAEATTQSADEGRNVEGSESAERALAGDAGDVAAQAQANAQDETRETVGANDNGANAQTDIKPEPVPHDPFAAAPPPPAVEPQAPIEAQRQAESIPVVRGTDGNGALPPSSIQPEQQQRIDEIVERKMRLAETARKGPPQWIIDYRGGSSEEVSEEKRVHVVRIIAMMRSSQATDFLERATTEDPSAKVRDTAKDLLASRGRRG